MPLLLACNKGMFSCNKAMLILVPVISKLCNREYIFARHYCKVDAGFGNLYEYAPFGYSINKKVYKCKQMKSST